MQAQVTMRPTRGLSFQTTYTWSRNLADTNPNDYTTMQREYYLSSQHRSHQLSSYGTFDMPLGANGFVFRNATGIFKKAIEGWQMSWVASMTSGVPGSVTGNGTSFWGDNRVDLLRPDLFDTKSGKVTWEEGAASGRFYGNRYAIVTDTAYCNTLHTQLRLSCSNVNTGRMVLQDVATGAVVMAPSAPMTHGNFDFNSLTGPGRWNLDMAMGKSVEVMEGKRIDFRIDAQNVFNHPTPSGTTAYSWNSRFTSIYNPNFSLANNYSPFGWVQSKGGHRTFQAKVRISW